MATGVADATRSFFEVENPGLVGLVSLTHGVNEFFSIVVPPLFPFLVADSGLGATYTEASLLVVAFFLTYSVCQLPVGPLADVYSNRVVLAAGTAVLAGGVALVGLAPTYPGMVAGMIVAGVGGSTYHPTGMSLISDVEPSETHGRSMGLHGTAGSAGTVLAPLLAVGVAELAGWRVALLVASGLGVAFAVGLYLAYPRVYPTDGPTRSDDFLAAVGRARGDAVDLRATVGRLREYVTTPRVLALFALFLVVGAEVRAVQTFAASFAVAATGLGEAYGGAVLSLTMVTAAVASTVAGGAVDRVDRAVFAAATFVGTALLVAALVFLAPGALLLAATFGVLGAVLYAVYPAANAIAASSVADEGSGSLFAVTNTGAAAGGAAGAYLVGAVASATSVQRAFLAVAGIAAVGVGVALVSRVVTTRG